MRAWNFKNSGIHRIVHRKGTGNVCSVVRTACSTNSEWYITQSWAGIPFSSEFSSDSVQHSWVVRSWIGWIGSASHWLNNIKDVTIDSLKRFLKFVVTSITFLKSRMKPETVDRFVIQQINMKYRTQKNGWLSSCSTFVIAHLYTLTRTYVCVRASVYVCVYV